MAYFDSSCQQSIALWKCEVTAMRSSVRRLTFKNYFVRWLSWPLCGLKCPLRTLIQLFILIILHSTHYLFSDCPKAYSEFSKSAPETSSSCRLYNNHVKDTQGPGNKGHVWPRCMICNGNHVNVACRQWKSKNRLPGLLGWPSKTSKK